MSSAQYQENRKLMRNLYEPETQVTRYQCKGSCSCSLGHRTPYDLLQYQKTVDGINPNYPTAIVPGWIPN